MIILLTHHRFDAIKTASHRPDNVNNNARGQCFGIGNMAAMVTRWLQRHRPMRDPVIIQISANASHKIKCGLEFRIGVRIKKSEIRFLFLFGFSEIWSRRIR